MGILERKEREKQEMRERIVKEATQAFVELGYEGLSVRAIADRIEYSPTVIYLHFRDKDELLLAVQEAAFGQLFFRFQQVIQIPDPWTRLETFAHEYLGFAFDNPELYDLLFTLKNPMRAIEQQDNPKWKHGHDAFNTLCEAVEECLQLRLLPPGNPEIIALTMWAHVHGLASLFLSQRLQMLEQPDTQAPSLMGQSLQYLMGMARQA